MSAITDLVRWYREKGVYQVYAKLAEELVPPSADGYDPFPEATLAAEVFERIGLPPGEFTKLSVPERVALLRKALAGEQAEPAATPTAADALPPKSYLVNWREILIALGLTYSSEDRERVRYANDQYNGPILFPGQGAQPKVNKAKVVEWWNGLEAQWSVGDSRARDSKPTVAAQHNYGKGGVVVPGIAGGVKRRRADRKR